MISILITIPLFHLFLLIRILQQVKSKSNSKNTHIIVDFLSVGCSIVLQNTSIGTLISIIHQYKISVFKGFNVLTPLPFYASIFFFLLVNHCHHLLFISYKFVKRFLVITFLFFSISSWNLHDMCQRFYVVRNEISVGSDIKWTISP